MHAPPWPLVALLGMAACGPAAPAPPPAQPEGYPTRRAELPPDDDVVPVTELALPCEGAPAPVVVAGRVLDSTGQPVAGMPVGVMRDDGTYEVRSRSARDGSYRLDLSGPAVFSVTDRRSTPGTRCSHDDLPPEARADGNSLVVEGLDFQVEKVCPVVVLALDPGGEPLADAEVWGAPLLGEVPEITARTDASGRATLQGLPCGELALKVRSERYLPDEGDAAPGDGLVHTCALPMMDGRVCTSTWTHREGDVVTLHSRAAVRVGGRVHDQAGVPLVGVEVRIGLEAQLTDADGRFSLLASSDLEHPAIHAPGFGGYLETIAPVQGAQAAVGASQGDRGGITYDITLLPSHDVEVRCLGVAPSACEDFAFTCGRAGEAEADASACHVSPGRTCACPKGGDVVVYGGGASVLVGVHDELAWLDLRPYNGGVSGRVEGVDRCWVSAARDGSGPPGRREPGLRSAQCSESRTFSMDRLPPGPWKITIHGFAAGPTDLSALQATWGLGPEATVSRSVVVGEDPIDLGTIAMKD